MSEKLKNILSSEAKNTSTKTLLQYLHQELNEQQQHELEKHLLNDAFESDAIEGLQTIENKEGINLMVEALNRDLKKKTARKKEARKKWQLQPQWWLYFSILILLIILVMIYIYLHKQLAH